MVRNGIPSFFFFRKWFGTEFQSFLFWKWFGKEFQGFIIANVLEWNGFSLPRNGSERNSEVFLFRETDGIPTELPSVPSCFIFRGIIFFSENGNPSCRCFAHVQALLRPTRFPDFWLLGAFRGTPVLTTSLLVCKQLAISLLCSGLRAEVLTCTLYLDNVTELEVTLLYPWAFVKSLFFCLLHKP